MLPRRENQSSLLPDGGRASASPVGTGFPKTFNCQRARGQGPRGRRPQAGGRPQNQSEVRSPKSEAHQMKTRLKAEGRAHNRRRTSAVGPQSSDATKHHPPRGRGGDEGVPWVERRPGRNGTDPGENRHFGKRGTEPFGVHRRPSCLRLRMQPKAVRGKSGKGATTNSFHHRGSPPERDRSKSAVRRPAGTCAFRFCGGRLRLGRGGRGGGVCRWRGARWWSPR